MWPQLVYKNSRNSGSCAVWWVHVTNVVGDFPMLCLHDESLSSVMVTKFNHLYFAGYLFIFVGFFLNSACPLFTFTCQSFGKRLYIKITPCGLYCFPVKSDMESKSGLQFTNWRNTRDVFTGYVGRKWAVPHQMGIGSLRCFISFMLPPKNIQLRKNVTSGEWYFLSPASCNRQRSQRVQRNIVTQQSPHNLYRCLVRTEEYPNIQADSSAWYRQGLWLRRLSYDYKGAASAPCGGSAAQEEIQNVPLNYCRDVTQMLEEKSELG